MSYYSLEIGEKLAKTFRILRERDKKQAEILKRKIGQILENPFQGKPLHFPMTGYWRVHVRNFVLVYKILEREKIVCLIDYDHHDRVYEK
jgi:addiction module RelE/StbE family toxin